MEKIKPKYRFLTTLIHPDKFKAENWASLSVTKDDLEDWFNTTNSAYELINNEGKFDAINAILQKLEIPDNYAQMSDEQKHNLKLRIIDYFRIDPDNISLDQQIKSVDNKIVELRIEIVRQHEILEILNKLSDTNPLDEITQVKSDLERQIANLEMQIQDLEMQIIRKNAAKMTFEESSAITISTTGTTAMELLSIPNTPAELHKRMQDLLDQIAKLPNVIISSSNNNLLYKRGNYGKPNYLLITYSKIDLSPINIPINHKFDFFITDNSGNDQYFSTYISDKGETFLSTQLINNQAVSSPNIMEFTKIYLYIKDFINKYISKDLEF